MSGVMLARLLQYFEYANMDVHGLCYGVNCFL